MTKVLHWFQILRESTEKPMSREQVIKVNTALLVFALSSLAGTIFWGGQIFEKLANIERQVQKMDSLYERVTLIEHKLNANGIMLDAPTRQNRFHDGGIVK